MPRKVYNTKADFDEDYSIGAESGLLRPNNRPEVRLNYNRFVMLPYCTRRAAFLASHFAWPTDTTIVLAGAGFGWTAEMLEVNHGYTNVISIDTSPWVQSQKDTNEEAEIDAAIAAVGLDPANGEGLALKATLNADSGNRRRTARDILSEGANNNGSRNRIRQALGGLDIQVGITEDVLTVLDDDECVELSNGLHAFSPATAIIHLVSVRQEQGQNPAYNWKALADWKALLPADTFVAIGSQEVL